MRLKIPRIPVACILLVIEAATLCSAAPSASLRGPRRARPNSAIIFPDERRRTTPAPPSGCTDYADRPGRCVPLRMCPDLRRQLDEEEPTAETVRRLRAGGCGVWRRRPLVCCGRGEVPTPPPPRSPEEHPNLPILEHGTHPCGVGFRPKVFGENITWPGEFPWVAVLAYTHPDIEGAEVNCGGTLIGLQYVLTAAHCVTNLPEGFELHSVRLGEHDLSTEIDCTPPSKDNTTEILCLPPPQVFNASEVIIHPQYDDPVRDQNDIALIRLDRPVVENDGVVKACLPLGAARLADPTGRRGTVTGFGLTEDGFTSDVMLKVSLPVLEQDRCELLILERGRRIGPGQLCAGGEVGKDSCVGDSGGPLVMFLRFGPPYYVIGVTSFGPLTCGVGLVPGVYTRVTEYLDWILDNVHD